MATTPIIEGLDFMLEHFVRSEVTTTPLFPRSIATLATGHRQIQVNSREAIFQRFGESNFIDCYMSMFAVNHLNDPNHIFIDIDKQHFTTDQEFNQAVEDTIQKNIPKIIGGDTSPTVLSSGNGIHIHLPIDMPGPLEDVIGVNHFK